MEERSARVLLIEDNPAMAERIREALHEPGLRSFEVEWVQQLSEGMQRLSGDGIAAVLLSLSDNHASESYGLEAFHKMHSAAPDIPILILADNEALAKEAVEGGAQDYIMPSHYDRYSLPRAVRSAIQQKAIESDLFAEKDRSQVTLNSISDAVLCTDVSGRMTFMNIVAENLTGWHREDAMGKPLAEIFKIIDGDTGMSAKDPMERAIEENRTVRMTANCILIRRDGSHAAIEDSAAPIRNRGGRIIGAVILFRDVSEARSMSGQIIYRAQHDLLTDLPNRVLLNDRILQSISLAQRAKRALAVMFVDLDNFKHINDTLGHAVGDQVLQSIARRLVASVRASDTVSRYGGDEFVVLLTEVTHVEDAATCAAKLLHILAPPHAVAGHQLHIGASIGISVFPGDGEDAGKLIQNADLAMYHSKESGRNKFQFFKHEMNQKAVERQYIENGLRDALARDEFVLEYQPKFDLRNGHITGAEALIRWRHPIRGMIYPGDFVPIAEESGLIIPIGRWVLREACHQACVWRRDQGLPQLTMAVNVSAVEFRDKHFIPGVQAILAETGVDPRFLELELTESALMKQVDITSAILQELKIMNLCLAVDDFGTGYSSLNYLRQLPIDGLKIDQSFVRKVAGGSRESSVVSAIIAMGESLNYLVVAEGIETEEQRQHLLDRKCPMGQGYLLGRPGPAEKFADLYAASIAA
jgi:diguanylate cyclase (GGDEF)-like protein/PAS domain S-box-containing protein